IVGVCYGRNADDLPTPDKAVQLLQQHNIKYVRIYDANIQVLKAFANTGIELMIGITNSDLLPFSQFQSNADTWLKNSILPYYPATKITYITVGAEALNFRTIKVMVTETGWPSKGSPKEKAATPDNAQIYNTNLVRHVINNTGTPAKPGEAVDTYIFSLYNENRKPGLESERNWGLFYPDQTSVYNLDLTGRGASIASFNSTASWCIASSNATQRDLQNALDWACGTGNVDCSPILPSQPCFEPDALVSHASYAFNVYYQQNGATDIACSFGGTGVRVDKDPSMYF
ncbi:Glucan endo-1,3-beta-glucosidase 13, partial [Linum perenne]